MVWLFEVMVYLGWMPYVILAHIVYLLSSILGFNVIQNKYVDLVKAGLQGFMTKIKDKLVETSFGLYVLMEILILHFCVIINTIFVLIEGNLIFYLYLVQKQIDLDYVLLIVDIELFKELLTKLDSEVFKYILILYQVKEFLKSISILSPTPANFSSIFSALHKVLCKLICKLKSICSICDKVTGISCSPGNGCTSQENIIVRTRNISNHELKVSIMNIDLSETKKFQNLYKYIKNLLKMIEKDDIFNLIVSSGLMYEVGKLYILEPINLGKLFFLITQIQNLYLKILIRSYLLVCTILFYKEIKHSMDQLFELIKLNCSKPSEFLGRCSQVEKNGQCVLDKINECITKLGESSNSSKCLGVPTELLKLYINIINILVLLKFYLDLMMMQILIFKNIILTLIEMAVSSAILDGLIEVIGEIRDIDKAIPTLIVAEAYLRAFHFIQLHNSMTIFGLSSRLLFSEFIHEHFRVLLFNLQSIKQVIWGLECYIHHLLVFRHVTNSLNSFIKDIGGLLQIVIDIYEVIICINKLIDKLNLIKSSMNRLNDIQEELDITNFKESANKIRHETQLISGDIGGINSQIKLIIGYLGRIYESFGKLLGIYYSLFVLISYVYLEIIKTNNKDTIETIIGNPYFIGLIRNVVGPCNKQLKFILAYLLDMWFNLLKLIKVVETAIVLIIAKMGWLSGLTSKLQTDIENINRGVVDMECAIEGVHRNLIRCTLLSSINNTINSNITSLGLNQMVSMYGMSNVMDYEVLVNRMLEFWTFSDQSAYVCAFVMFCKCAKEFETKHRDQRPSTFNYPLHYIKTSDVNPVSELLRDTMGDNVGNHMCLCLVIKYHLSPSVLKCILILRNEELGTLDTLSRKYERYNKLTCVNLVWKMLGLVLNIIYELTSLLRNRYTDVLTRKNDFISYDLYNLLTFLANVAHDITYPLHQWIIANLSRCCCMYSDDPDYHYIISITLYLSSLIENIWAMDTETVRMSIERLSLLYLQLEIYDLNSLKDIKVCCNPVFSLLVTKDCQKKAGANCCCCWCVSCYSLGIILIYLSFQCKLCNALCNNSKNPNGCKKIEEFCKVEDCECKCTDPKNGLYCLLKLALDSKLPCGSQELEKVLGECCQACRTGNGCCAQLLKKVKGGNYKLLLLGCECKCTEASKDEEFKGKIVTFKNPWGSSSVAVVVFCKCDKTGKPCCCLTTLIEKIEGKLTNLCDESKCVCDELKTICDQLCTEGCGKDCVCKTLQDQLPKICNGNGAGGECLCKQIKEKIGDCLKKCAEGKCKCKDKDGCCKCPCCKIVGHSLKILTRSCRQNVVEPYKRITIELLRYGNNKGELIRGIVKGINQGTLNRLYLVKNNLLTHPNHDITVNPLNTVKSRNWGYDTLYKHQVTYNSFSDEYPNLVNNPRTRIYRNRDTRKKLFKIIYMNWNTF